jgi:hypothetical protein
MPALTWRPGYALAAAILFLVEIAIALWIRDGFVRPYGGDILAVILVHLVLRAVTTLRVVPAAIVAFLIGVLVEVGQAVNLLGMLGLADHDVARVVLGTSFSIGDIACYAAGAAIAVLVDRQRKGQDSAPESLAFPRESP